MPRIRKLRGRHALDSRHERRRSGGDRNHVRVSVAALLAAACISLARDRRARRSSSPCRRPAVRRSASLSLWEQPGAAGSASPARGRRGSAAAASRARSAKATARRRPARSGSARRCTASRRIPACRLAYHRLVCGDWWDEDPRSPTYNTFRHVACGAQPRVRRRQRGALADLAAVPLLRGDRVQRAPGRAGPRLGDLPPRRRRLDRRLRLASGGAARAAAPLASARGASGDSPRGHLGSRFVGKRGARRRESAPTSRRTRRTAGATAEARIGVERSHPHAPDRAVGVAG